MCTCAHAYRCDYHTELWGPLLPALPSRPDTPDLIGNLSDMATDLAIQTANLAAHLRLQHDPQWQACLAHLDAAQSKLATLKVQYIKGVRP